MKITIKLLSLSSLAGLLALSACTPTKEIRNRPGFLSNYSFLEKVDEKHVRYVNPVLLSQCKKFMVSPVPILFKEYDGKALTAEQRQRTADFIRQSLIKALSDRYPIVTEPGADVAEIRVALTDVYKTSGKLGLSLEGEIIDNSGTQVAAVARTALSVRYVPDWHDSITGKEMINNWTAKVREAIDAANK